MDSHGEAPGLFPSWEEKTNGGSWQNVLALLPKPFEAPARCARVTGRVSRIPVAMKSCDSRKSYPLLLRA